MGSVTGTNEEAEFGRFSYQRWQKLLHFHLGHATLNSLRTTCQSKRMGITSSLIASLLAKELLGYTVGEIGRLGKRRVYNFFGIKTEGQKLEESLENVREELEELQGQKRALERAHEKLDETEAELTEKQEELAEKRNRISRFERIMRSLERKGISRKEIIKKYERAIPVVIVSYTKQHAPEKEYFVSSALREKLGAVNLGSGNLAIPPEKVVEKGLDDGDALEQWFEDEVYEGVEERKSIIRFATIADLRKDIYWRDDYDYPSRYGTSVAEALGIEKIMESEVFMELLDAGDRAAVEEVIKAGDIGFFASRWVDSSDLASIHENQTEIENRLDTRLGALNLGNLARADAANIVAEVIADYVSLPEEEVEEIGEGIVDEANIWKRELQ